MGDPPVGVPLRLFLDEGLPLVDFTFDSDIFPDLAGHDRTLPRPRAENLRVDQPHVAQRAPTCLSRRGRSWPSGAWPDGGGVADRSVAGRHGRGGFTNPEAAAGIRGCLKGLFG